MSEQQYAKEIMEGQIEEERATLNLYAYKVRGHGLGTYSSAEEHKERLSEFVPEESYVGGTN